jgi:hypothetical protein
MLSTALRILALVALALASACRTGSREPQQPTAVAAASTTTAPIRNQAAPIPSIAAVPAPSVANANSTSTISSAEKGVGSETSPTAHPAENPAGDDSAASVPAENLAAVEIHSYNLSNGRKLLLENAKASILDRSGKLLAKNEQLIRTEGNPADCFAEFLSVAVVKSGFVLEQRNCGGWSYILERLEFRLARSGGDAYLEKLSLTCWDRREPDKDWTRHTLTAKDLGRIKFEDIDFERLYRLVFEKDPKCQRVPE